MQSSNVTLLENKRSREVDRVGKKLLQAMERDMFFFNHVKNLPEGKKLVALFDLFNEMDPTPNLKYLKWLVNNYTKGKFRIEDKARVKEALENFNRFKPRLKQYGFSPDINQYNFHSLEEMIDKIKGGDNIEGNTEYHNRFEELDEDEYEVLYDGPYGILVTPKTKRASCVLGRGTKWCTAAKRDNMFDEYNNGAPLYIWKDNTGLYQFWFGDIPQFMDSRDRELSYDRIREMGEKYPPLRELFKNGENEIKSKPKAAYDYALYIIEGRWPEAEPHIMKEPEWAFWYAHDVIKDRWPEAEPYIMKEPEKAYWYANDVIKDRWPEAEPYIMKEPEAARLYAQNIIGDRWLEAEPYIMKDPAQACWYARDVIKGRWPDVEPHIMKDLGRACLYAQFVIKDRWPEAEPLIIRKPIWAYRYAKNVIEGRWPEAEPYIMKEPERAYEYAKDVIKDRWPEAEPYIMKEPDLAYPYAKDVIKNRWPEAEPYIIKDPEWAYEYAKDVIKDRWPEAEPFIKRDGHLFSLYKSLFLDK